VRHLARRAPARTAAPEAAAPAVSVSSTARIELPDQHQPQTERVP
jgi:hypothetical protein